MHEYRKGGAWTHVLESFLSAWSCGEIVGLGKRLTVVWSKYMYDPRGLFCDAKKLFCWVLVEGAGRT